MEHRNKVIWIMIVVLFFTAPSLYAQEAPLGYFGEEISSLNKAIGDLYNTQKVAFGGIIFAVSNILALGIILYMLNKIFTPLLRAEPIIWGDLIKPITVFFLVLAYPVVLNLVELTLSPIASATEAMNFNSQETVLQAHKEAYMKSPEWQLYIGDNGQGDFDKYVKEYGTSIKFAPGAIDEAIDKMKFGTKQTLMEWDFQLRFFISNVLNMLFQGAILCINFVRTFYLIILAILGPVAIAVVLLPGMSNAPFHWLGQFISKWLWLPIANVLATMLNVVQKQIINDANYGMAAGSGEMFSAADVAGMIFMMIGLVSFFAVPSVASMTMQASGAAAGALGQSLGRKASSVVKSAPSTAVKVVGGAPGMVVGAGQSFKNASQRMASKIQGSSKS
jgi:conjugative transposon TraJ protein